MSLPGSAALGMVGLLLTGLAPLCLAQVPVLTYKYDGFRTGQNLQEATLTPDSVNPDRFGLLFVQPVDGYVYGQPLYMPGVAIPGKGIHNVVYIVTEHDSVYAFDAEDSIGRNAAPLWKVSFLDASRGVTTVPSEDTPGCQRYSLYPELGITDTPVIDPETNSLFVVAMTRERDGERYLYAHRLHALDLATGAEQFGSPVLVQATVAGTGGGSVGGMVRFDAALHKNRPGLALANGTVYTCWGSHCDGGTYHGWVLGYDARTLQAVSAFNVTPDGRDGSVWSAGAAPAVDADGNLFFATANGTFDADRGGRDYGMSALKLSGSDGVSVLDYFTPFDYANQNDLDHDLGSSGVLALPDQPGPHPHLLVATTKHGSLYLLDRDNLGQYTAGENRIVQEFRERIEACYHTPAYFGGLLYIAPAGSAFQAYAVVDGRLTEQPVSQTPDYFAYPGLNPVVSANGQENAIVWAIENRDPSGQEYVGQSVLHAYSAWDLSVELYRSDEAEGLDALGRYVKFSVPTVANGRVYVGTQSGLAVLGPR